MSKQHRWNRAVAAMVSGAMLLSPLAASAQQYENLDLSSSGGYEDVALPSGTSSVELLQARQGKCEQNRTWGYDLSAGRLWVMQGCGGTFRVTREGGGYAGSGAAAQYQGQPQAQSSGSSGHDNRVSNRNTAIAAAAAIAGIALLVKKNRDDKRKEQSSQSNDGWNSGGGGSSAYGSPIHNGSNLCIDVQGGNIRPGTPVIISPCHGRANQQLSFTGNDELRVGDLCLDIQGANRNDGAPVMVWSCTGGANQKWRGRNNEIQSGLNYKCLDGSGRAGSQLTVQSCNGNNSQQWWW